jgi:phage major head subunit gpT-like protein
MEINPGFLMTYSRSLDMRFRDGLATITPEYSKIAMTVPSSGRGNVYPLRNMLPTIREWVGNRNAEELISKDFEIRNKHFEGTVRVKRDDVEDDQYGFYGNEAEALGRAAALHPDTLVFALLDAAATTLCYDGQYFFDTDHPTNSGGQQSNKGTTALTADSTGIGVLNTAEAAMLAITNDSGQPLMMRPDTLIVPAALASIGRALTAAPFLGVGSSQVWNPWNGRLNLVVAPQLSDANNWYLADTSKGLRGVIFQSRKAPQLVAQTSLTDDSVFERNEFVWGADYRGNAGLALWQTMYGGIVA